MHRWCEDIKWYWKKKQLYASEQDTEEVKKKREAYLKLVKEIAVEDLVFIDESGTYLNECRLYGRAYKSHRVYGQRPFKLGARISMIVAANMKRIISALYGMWSTDGNIF